MRVCIVGAGSGDSGLMTLRGLYIHEGSITGRRCEAESLGMRLAEVIMS